MKKKKIFSYVQCNFSVFVLKLDQTEKVEILKTEHRFAFSTDLLHAELKKRGLGNV